MSEQEGRTIPLGFTQYLRPDGRQVQITVDIPATLQPQITSIHSAGFRFEAEVLTTGEVSLTVFDPEDEVDVAIEVVPNGPGIRAAVQRLIAAGVIRALVGD